MILQSKLNIYIHILSEHTYTTIHIMRGDIRTYVIGMISEKILEAKSLRRDEDGTQEKGVLRTELTKTKDV